MLLLAHVFIYQVFFVFTCNCLFLILQQLTQFKNCNIPLIHFYSNFSLHFSSYFHILQHSKTALSLACILNFLWNTPIIVYFLILTVLKIWHIIPSILLTFLIFKYIILLISIVHFPASSKHIQKSQR